MYGTNQLNCGEKMITVVREGGVGHKVMIKIIISENDGRPLINKWHFQISSIGNHQGLINGLSTHFPFIMSKVSLVFHFFICSFCGLSPMYPVVYVRDKCQLNRNKPTCISIEKIIRMYTLGMWSKVSGKFAILYPYKIAWPPPPSFYLVGIFPIYVRFKHHR